MNSQIAEWGRDAASSQVRENEIKEKKYIQLYTPQWSHILVPNIQGSLSFELSNNFNSSAAAESCFTKMHFWRD